jgi:hypothetical protein
MDKLAELFPDAALRSGQPIDADVTLRAVEGCDLVYDCIGLPGSNASTSSDGAKHRRRASAHDLRHEMLARSMISGLVMVPQRRMP